MKLNAIIFAIISIIVVLGVEGRRRRKTKTKGCAEFAPNKCPASCKLCGEYGEQEYCCTP